MARRETDSPFVPRPKEDEYQQRWVTLLAEERRWSAVLTAVDTDLLCFNEVMRHFYFVAKRAYWSKELHLEPLVRDR